MTKLFSMDGTVTAACIARADTPEQAATLAPLILRDPFNYLDYVRFHTSFNYLKIRQRFSTSIYFYATAGSGVVTVQSQSVYLGTATIDNAHVFVRVNGAILFGSTLIQTTTNGVRNMYITASGRSIYAKAVTQIIGSTAVMPAYAAACDVFVATADPEW